MTLTANGLQNAVPYKWTYADAAARGAATGFVAADVGSWAVQLSDGTVWELTATTPTWAQRGGGSGLTNPMTTAGDLITGGAAGVPQRLAVGASGQVLTVVSGAPAWAVAGGSTSGARVFATTTQSIPSGAWTALAFDAEHVDDAGYHDPATNNTRLIAVTAGWYQLWVNARIDGGTGQRGLRLRLNGGATMLASRFQATDGSADILFVSTLWRCSAADYVEAEIYQSSGGALSTVLEADDTTEAAIVRLP